MTQNKVISQSTESAEDSQKKFKLYETEINVLKTKIFELENEIHDLKNETHSFTQNQKIQKSKFNILSNLTAGIAHEINNPLMVLSSLSYLIKKLYEQKEYDEMPDRIEKIHSTIFKISKIINGFRTFAQSSEKEKNSTLEIIQILNSSIDLCAEKFKNNNIKILVETNSLDHLLVTVKESLIIQVILNILFFYFDLFKNINQFENSIFIIVNQKKNKVELIFKVKSHQNVYEIGEQNIFNYMSDLDYDVCQHLVALHEGELHRSLHQNYIHFEMILPIYLNQY